MYLEIENIEARQILDSRGVPTIETSVFLSDGTIAYASVPSGASKCTFEAVELRDSQENSFCGKGVSKAIDNINEIITPNLIEEDAANQRSIDNLMLELDGTFNKSIPEPVKYALTVGLCGGFTTFSTFAFEVFDMLKRGEYFISLFYTTSRRL